MGGADDEPGDGHAPRRAVPLVLAVVRSFLAAHPEHIVGVRVEGARVAFDAEAAACFDPWAARAGLPRGVRSRLEGG